MLFFQDLSVQQKKTDAKLRSMDPKKAAQAERLGMGVAKSSGISHSALTEMNTIEQEEPKSGRGGGSNWGVADRSSRGRDEDDDYDSFGGFDRWIAVDLVSVIF